MRSSMYFHSALAGFLLTSLFLCCLSKAEHFQTISRSLSLHTISDSSYGCSVVVNARPTSVTENLLDDKELPCSVDHLESEKVTNEKLELDSPTPSDSKLCLTNIIVPPSDKNCGEYNNERDSIYAPVESYSSQNTFYNDYQTGDLSNWPYDLSRTRARSQPLEYPLQYQNSDANLNFRNLTYSSFNGAMKGNLMALSHFNDFISPPSSVSSSSGYEVSDNNNNSYINIEQAFYQSAIDEVIREELKLENRFSVEDGGNGGNYTTLTNATASAPIDLYHIHDYQRNYAHNHSTSSGGDSRSPDGYGNDDYDGTQFTQLTNLTTRSNGMYPSSPSAVDHNIMSYDSTHVLSPTR